MPSILNPPPPAPRAPRRLTGLHVGLIVVAAIALCFGSLFVIGFVQGFTRIRNGQAKFAEAGKAPGAAEVVAAGCRHAMVMGHDELLQSRGLFVDLQPADVEVSTGVFCIGRGALPDCATVAKAYLAAPGRRAGPLFVSVERQNPDTTIVCRRRFSDTGQDLGVRQDRDPQ